MDDIEDDIEDEVIESSIPESVPGSAEDSIKESIEQSAASDKKQLQNARMMLGSEEAVIQKSRDLLGGRPEKKPQSPFKKDSF